MCQNWVWELVDTSPLHIKHSECLDIGHTLVDLWSNRGIDCFVVQVGDIERFLIELLTFHLMSSSILG